MNENNSEKKSPLKNVDKIYDACPHCGRELSPWEKVLLSVDHMIMCKGCWYRIILDVFKDDDKQQ